MPTKKVLDFNSKKTPFQIRAGANDTAEIILYAAIGASWWGDSVSAKQFSDEMKALPKSTKTLNVRINSPGGDVFDGITIYNRLKQFSRDGGTVNVIIDGLAASIASIIALAGDSIEMGEAAQYMVHLPWTFAAGNRNDLDNTVQRLMDVEEQMIGIYAKKSGLDRSEIKAMLEAETWLDADTAIEKGFVDTKSEDSVPIAASAMEAKWIMRAPKNYNSETKAVESAILDLKKKISGKLARK